MERFGYIQLASARRMTIIDAKHSHGFQVRGEHSENESVQLYRAVVSRNGNLINMADYVAFEQEGEVS